MRRPGVKERPVIVQVGHKVPAGSNTCEGRKLSVRVNEESFYVHFYTIDKMQHLHYGDCGTR